MTKVKPKQTSRFTWDKPVVAAVAPQPGDTIQRIKAKTAIKPAAVDLASEFKTANKNYRGK